MLTVFVCNMRESIIKKLILKKLSVNEAKWTDLLASNCATIQHVLILKFTFSQLPFLSRNGPEAPVVKRMDDTIHWIVIYSLDSAIQRLNNPGQLPLSLLDQLVRGLHQYCRGPS